jgi:AcrR family transcriptional regulator
MAVSDRRYRMTARADAVRHTSERILDAAIEVFWEQPTDRLSLDEVARRAGVTKQTVLRHFGTRSGLLAAAGERTLAAVRTERGGVPTGDLDAALASLLDHYERMGDGVLRMLAEEVRNPALTPIVERGRDLHAQWCETVFAPSLAGLGSAARSRRLAQLIAVTDVYTWKLLSRDRGLSRRQTILALRELLQPISGDPA